MNGAASRIFDGIEGWLFSPRYSDVRAAAQERCSIDLKERKIMAKITSAVLKLAASGNNVNATVEYTMIPDVVEMLAGSVFSEKIELFGEDGAVDQLRATLPIQVFAVNATTTPVPRTRSLLVSKATLNEDPATDNRGSELSDQIFAKVTLTYAANAPVGNPPIAPGFSSLVIGVWK
ncbi:hypothetical protein WMF30_08100 [Sorangium sp. So ce134]